MDASTYFAFPNITMLNVATGEVRTVSHDTGREAIALGNWIETAPADPARSEQWHSDLREKALATAKDAKIPRDDFKAYDDWCAERGMYSLPATEARIVSYLLDRAKSGTPQHQLREMQRHIVAVHDLISHPPKHLTMLAWNAFVRALSFAKIALRDDMRLLDMETAAPIKASEMFPDGFVPMRWTDVAA
jgi:hypothetical protein